MLTVVFGESTMSRTLVQLWYNRFKEGREDVNDDARPGGPFTSKTDKKIEVMKKIFVESLLERLSMLLEYHTAHVKPFLRMF